MTDTCEAIQRVEDIAREQNFKEGFVCKNPLTGLLYLSFAPVPHTQWDCLYTVYLTEDSHTIRTGCCPTPEKDS